MIYRELIARLRSEIAAATFSGPSAGDIARADTWLDASPTRMSADSRDIVPGALFVATRGFSVDGHDFIDAAIAAGASCVIAETARPAGDEGPHAWVQVPDATFALAVVADSFYGHPANDVAVLATTGTNGKSTVSFLLFDLLTAVGSKPGLVSTVEVVVGDVREPTIFTTPPAPAFQSLLARMRDAGCTHAAVEASSHGLHQHRMAAFSVAVGGFTNLSRDHLDYHETMADYRAAKERLFTRLAKTACFNIDDAVGHELANDFGGLSLTVSAKGDTGADIWAEAPTFSLAGCTTTLHTPTGRRDFSLPLIGAHNLENALVALGMAMLAGIDQDAAIAALGHAKGAPGRLERVTLDTPGVATPRAVFVDYAHTPDALQNVLTSLRPLVRGGGQLIAVFGAGGDRDKGKRPEMARAAASVADVVIVTSDNPRTEEPNAILDDICAGLPTSSSLVVERQVDRAVAIENAVATSAGNDVIVIAGKGHEDYQIVGTEKLPFDDVMVARDALVALAEREANAAAGGQA